jgi:hypothetical protein
VVWNVWVIVVGTPHQKDAALQPFERRLSTDDGAGQGLVGRLGLPLPHQRGKLIERGMVRAWSHRSVLPVHAAVPLRLHPEREVHRARGLDDAGVLSCHPLWGDSAERNAGLMRTRRREVKTHDEDDQATTPYPSFRHGRRGGDLLDSHDTTISETQLRVLHQPGML